MFVAENFAITNQHEYVCEWDVLGFTGSLNIRIDHVSVGTPIVLLSIRVCSMIDVWHCIFGLNVVRSSAGPSVAI